MELLLASVLIGVLLLGLPLVDGLTGWRPTTASASGGGASSFTVVSAGGRHAYNGDGLRMAKSAAGTTTAFTWDVSGELLLLLTEGTGAATTKYIYGPDGLPTQSLTPTGEIRYYHHDQLGSTRLITDIDGNELGQTSFDAYGRPTAASGVAQPFGYTGQYTDAETGFVYLRARYYDPTTGQFLK